MHCYTGMYDDKELGKSYMTVLNEWECEDCKRKVTTPEGFPPDSTGTCRFTPKVFAIKNTEVLENKYKKKKRRHHKHR